jgi:hypothetical protein
VRGRRIGLERLAHAVAVDAGHLDVGDHQIRAERARHRERLAAVGRRADLVAVVLEQRRGVAVDQRRVVGEQDQLARAGGRAEHVEHLGVAERHQQEAVGVDLARQPAIGGLDADHHGGDRLAGLAQQLDRGGERAIGQPARQQHRARRELGEPALELGDRGDLGDGEPERLERPPRDLGEHRLVADQHDVHSASGAPRARPSSLSTTRSSCARSCGLVMYSSTPASNPRTRSIRSPMLVTITIGASAYSGIARSARVSS